MHGEMPMEEMYPLICEAIKNGGQFILVPKGNSMLPTIEPLKDKIVLTEIEKLHKNDIILYRRTSGAFVAHRIIQIKNGNYTICGDNQFCVEKGLKRECFVAFVSQIRKADGRIITSEEIRAAKSVLRLKIHRLPRFLIYKIKKTLYPVYKTFFKRS